MELLKSSLSIGGWPAKRVVVRFFGVILGLSKLKVFFFSKTIVISLGQYQEM